MLLCESYVGTDGSHAPVLLPRQLVGRGPQGDVCEECGNDHVREEPFRRHIQHPLAAYESIASGRVPIQTFKANQAYICDFLLQLEQELTHFDLFVRRVEGEFEALIAQVAAQRDIRSPLR